MSDVASSSGVNENNNNNSNNNNNNNNNNSNSNNNNNDFKQGSPWAKLPLTAKSYYDEEGASEMVSGLHSNNVLVIRDCKKSRFVVRPNQRLHKIVMMNCINCELWVLDSAVITSQTTVLIDCDKCKFLFEDVDMRKIECYSVKNSEVILIDSLPLVEYTNVYWRSDCQNNTFNLAAIIPGMVFGMSYKITKSLKIQDIDTTQRVSYIDGLKKLWLRKYPNKDTTNADLGLTKEEHIAEVKKVEAEKLTLSFDELNTAYDDERKEYEDPEEEVVQKAKEIAAVLKSGRQHVVCYSGAGISTSANVPDYRGPQGVWTLKDKGVFASKSLDFDEIYPTYAHYAITELVKRGLIHFVISTNMDALHMRTGLPAHLICEQHGNSYKEVCDKCHAVYYRQYDTHEDGDPMSHVTGRQCKFCNGNLIDTIVNFAENLHEPDQMASLWQCRKSTISLVLGTSMNVQPAASYPLECLKNNGKLFIVNLQRTPYDELAATRIFARTDFFMRTLLAELGINPDLDTSVDVRGSWDPAEQPPRQPEPAELGTGSKLQNSLIGRFFFKS